MEDDGELQTPRSPFWMQTTTNLSRIQRYRRRLSSLLFNSFVLIIFLLLFALISMMFIIPSLIQFSSNIFKPNLVKRSWDSINLILVLIALLFGFLSRNISNDEKLNFDNGFDRRETEISGGAPIMYDQSMNSVIGLRRQRTSISYPDLRELSPPWDHRATDPWRFSDDTHLNYYRVLESNRNSFRQRSRRGYNSNLYTPTPDLVTPVQGLYLPQPQPPQPPVNPVKQKMKKVYRNVALDDGERNSSFGNGKILSPETDSSEKKGGKDERKKDNTEKRRARSSEPRRLLSPVLDPLEEPTSPPPVSPSTERKLNSGDGTKDFFTSFYHKKKKRQRDRSVDNLGALIHQSQPPAVKFQTPVPPTPPPLPPAPRTAYCAPRATITRVAPFVTDKPGAHLMNISFTGIDDSSSGGESPMKQIPPPPPLPPFKMPDWKFSVEGDFVRLQSTLSSRSTSPDGDEARSPSSDVKATPVFCQSSDVDTKADSFIARFRAGLKLERMSKLGPGPSDN